MKLVLDPLAQNAISMARALHNRAVGGRLAAHEKRNANQPVVTHDGNLRRGTIRKHIKKRNDAIDGKVNMEQHITGLVKHRTHRQVDVLEVGEQAPKRVGWQGSEKVIIGGMVHFSR